MEGYGGVLHISIWYHAEVSIGDHGLGEMAHDGSRLDVQIAQHLITAPTTYQFDSVVVDVGAEECHCACGTKGPGRYICFVEANSMSHDGGDIA